MSTPIPIPDLTFAAPSQALSEALGGPTDTDVDTQADADLDVGGVKNTTGPVSVGGDDDWIGEALKAVADAPPQSAVQRATGGSGWTVALVIGGIAAAGWLAWRYWRGGK